MGDRDAARAKETTPRVLVVSAQQEMLKRCADMLARTGLVRTCLGARAARRAALAWDPTAIVLCDDPPAIDGVELLRFWHSAGPTTPDVVLYSSAGLDRLERIARPYPHVHVLTAPAAEGVLSTLVLRMHRASLLRREADTSGTSGTSGTRRRQR